MAHYLGTLSREDPLHAVLAQRAFPGVRHPVFHVEHLSKRHLVYRYTEQQTRRAIVGKFFRPEDARIGAVARMKGEFRNLLRLRYIGFNASPHYVANPVCTEWRLGLAVAEDYVHGKDLDHYIRAAARENDEASLRRILVNLAAFLRALHAKTARGTAVRLDDVGAYYAKVVRKLESQRLLSSDRVKEYLALRDRWLEKPHMGTDSVIVHGDATPTNFLFPNDRDVVAIDLERMKEADPVYDVGMVCGELKHGFLWRVGNRYAAESFIRHFLRNYVHDPTHDGRFWEITRRIPFYMALTELRIARNNWLDWQYRKHLIWEAHECLVWGLRL